MPAGDLGGEMDDSKWERWSALGGILFVVIVVTAAAHRGITAEVE